MALLIMNGFEGYADTDDLDRDEYINTYGTMAFETGRISGQALTLNSFDDDVFLIPEAPSGATWYCGFAIKFNNSPSSDTPFLWIYSVNQAEIRIYITSSGQIQVRRAGTLITGATSTGVIDPPNWNHIVVKIFMDNSTGTVELWLNGTKEVDITGVDTLINTASIAYLQFASVSASLPIALDDVYFGDTTGTDMTDQVGDCHIEMLTPNANGTTNNFTASPAVSNYLNVDDGNSPDDDTTYNHSSTATHKELYACSNITGTVDVVHAVQVRAMARKEDAGNRTINLICRNNVTEVDSGQKGLATSYGMKSKIYENDPDGGGNWTEADVNAMEIGLEIGT